MKLVNNFFSFMIGAVFGSFANVLIYRIPRDESIIFPGSYCPVCGHPLSWKDNIPIISFLALKGRCRYCGANISPRYPFVEALMGLLFLVGYNMIGFRVKLFFVLVSYFLLLVISWIDIEHGVVPDVLTFSGILVGLVGHELMGIKMFIFSLVGVSVAMIIGYGVRIFGEAAFGREAFGEGDITTLAMIGALLGPEYVVVGLFGGAVVGVVFTIGSFILTKNVSSEVKFCPFIAIAVFLYSIANSYYNLFYVF